MSSIASIPAVTYAIGDIHGRFDLLTLLLDQILGHRRQVQGTAKLILLGDYVDRGPKKGQRDVIRLLRSGKLQQDFDEVILLKGNHDATLIEAIEGFQEGLRCEIPLPRLRNQYGNVERVFEIKRIELKQFLKGLPLYHSDGVRLFTHAGLAAGDAIETLSEKDLLWYRGPVQDKLGRFVVHGHTPVVREPEVTEYAANIDTGAYATDQLTCAIFLGKSRQPIFLSTPFDLKKTDLFERELKVEKLERVSDVDARTSNEDSKIIT